MAQVLKPELRDGIVRAATELFAEAGYAGATMAQIAERAGMATGNLYRYFANKDELFYTVVSDELAARFLRLLNARVKTLIDAGDLARLDDAARADAQALLAFWVEHRLEVVILLDRSQGSRHEGFAQKFVDALMKGSLAKLSVASGGERLSPAARFLLTQIFRNTLQAIVAILETHRDEAQIRHAIGGFWSYQLAGLAGFAKWATHG